VLASLAYHIIDKKKNPGAERKEAPFLFSHPPPSLPFPSLPFFFFFWGYAATNPLLAKKTWCEKRAKKMKGKYIQVITKKKKKTLFSKNQILDVQNGSKWT
jgi:hypothetical protein